ncbi:hypothetical protein ACFV3E_36710 [Streptomyces sp. NPDC059718]
METNNSRRWTSDDLFKPGGVAIYTNQQRQRFRAIADDIRALHAETRDDLATIKFPGDKWGEASLRARRTARPLARMEALMLEAMKEARRFERSYEARYVVLPAKRKQKALEKRNGRAEAVNSRTFKAATALGGLMNNARGDKGITVNDTDSSDETKAGKSFMDIVKGA